MALPAGTRAVLSLLQGATSESLEIKSQIYLGLFIFFHSFKLFAATSLTTLLLSACGGGGDPAPAPTGLFVTAAESSVSVKWDVTNGVDYWLFYGPKSIAPTDVSSMAGWIGLPGGNVILDLGTSPRVITGLVNGTEYAFTANGRTDGGPGGPGATPFIATPRLAGATWNAETPITNAPALRAVAHRATVATTETASVSTYVAGGVGGAMYSSNDGTNWTTIAPITSNTLNGASYGGGSYKLVGDAGVVLTSSDAKSGLLLLIHAPQKTCMRLPTTHQA